jgi:DNA-binding GntR family transcriptional regulator
LHAVAGRAGERIGERRPEKDGENSMAVREQSSEPDSESTRLDRAYQALKQGIIQGTYQPNQRLTEMELSQVLGVSRPTARQALVRLEQEGLVVIQPNRGASVRSLTVPEALRTLRIREVLDGLAAALAAESATDEELAELQRIVEEMEEQVKANELLAYSRLNGQLHTAILRAARDETLYRMLASLNHALVRYQYRTILVPGRQDQSLREHQEIVRALVARDSAAAEQAMRVHVSHVRHTLSQAAQLLA